MINEDIVKFISCQNIADELKLDLELTSDGSLALKGQFVVKVESRSDADGITKGPRYINLAHYGRVSDMYSYLYGFRRAVKLYRDFKGD